MNRKSIIEEVINGILVLEDVGRKNSYILYKVQCKCGREWEATKPEIVKYKHSCCDNGGVVPRVKNRRIIEQSKEKKERENMEQRVRESIKSWKSPDAKTIKKYIEAVGGVEEAMKLTHTLAESTVYRWISEGSIKYAQFKLLELYATGRVKRA